MGILSSPDLKVNLDDLLPPKWGSIELWRNYVDNVEVCNKIIHRPTAEVLIYTAIDDPGHASLDAMALMFAVFFMSATILDSATVQRITGEDKVTSLQRFKTGLEQAFAKADFLEHPTVKTLEALAVYLVSPASVPSPSSSLPSCSRADMFSYLGRPPHTQHRPRPLDAQRPGHQGSAVHRPPPRRHAPRPLPLRLRDPAQTMVAPRRPRRPRV